MSDSIETVETANTASDPQNPLSLLQFPEQQKRIEPCLILYLTLGKPGMKVKERTSKVARQDIADADTGNTLGLKVEKDLLPKGTLSELVSYDLRLKEWVKNRSKVSPRAMKGAGSHMIPPQNALAVRDGLKAWVQGRESLVTALVDGYEAKVEERRLQLEPLGLFNAAQYPTKAALRDAFYVTIEWEAYGVRNAAAFAVDPQWAEELMQETRNRLKEAEEVGRALIYEQTSKIIKRMKEAVEPRPDGSRLRFKATLLPAWEDFIQTVGTRLDDPKLMETLAGMKRLLNGQDTESLKGDENLQKLVREEAAKAEACILGALETMPRRKVKIDDDEEVEA